MDMTLDDIANAIESGAHALADVHAKIDEAWYLRGVIDALLGRYCEDSYRNCRYYRQGFTSTEDAF